MCPATGEGPGPPQGKHRREEAPLHQQPQVRQESSGLPQGALPVQQERQRHDLSRQEPVITARPYLCASGKTKPLYYQHGEKFERTALFFPRGFCGSSYRTHQPELARHRPAGFEREGSRPVLRGGAQYDFVTSTTAPKQGSVGEERVFV